MIIRKLTIRIIFGLFLLISIIEIVRAEPANPTPVKYKQPDGTTVTIVLKGDEKFSWRETPDGYTLLSNEKSGLEYATYNTNGDLVCSGILAHNESDRTDVEKEFRRNTQKKLWFSKKQLQDISASTQVALKSATATTAFTPKGQKKLLLILIGFDDKPISKTQADFNGLMNKEAYNLNGAKGSVKDFFKETSYSQFDLTTDVAGPYTALNILAHYGGDVGEDKDVNINELITEAVNFADADVNFADYDNDGDGSVDGVYVVFAGYSQASSGVTTDIWSHAGSIPTLTKDGKTVSKYSCSNELLGSSGSEMTTIGVICHEFGHVCGAMDFYDTDGATGGTYLGSGNWDLMANGLRNGSPSGCQPAHFNPRTKIEFDWLTPITLSSPVSITNMPDIKTNPVVYKINTTTTNEYFLLENRQQTGFNAALPGHGLMIYKHNPITFSYNRENATHPQGFYSVCASATTNPSANPADYGDINSAGCPFPGSSTKTSFTDETTPSAKSIAGNNSFKPITGISENNTTKTIGFTFMGGNTCTPPTTQATALTATNIQENELTLNWTRGNGNNVLVLARRNSAINTTPLNGTVFNANSSFGAGDLIDAGTYVVYNGTETNVTITDLLKNYTYYFAVYEYSTTDNCYLSPALTGSATTSGCTSCIPTASTKGSIGITNVNFNSINNSSASNLSGYTDYSDIITTVTAGTNYALNVTNYSYTNTVYTKAWIDWNNDCTFQPSEEYDFGASTNDAVVSKQILIPDNAYSGYVTMRIRTRYNAEPTSCDNNNSSETEDYTLKISGGCTPPTAQATNFSATNIQNNQATINWTRGNGENVLVVARQGTEVDSYMIGATDLIANAAFGSGAEIGTGNYIVYNGTGNNVTVTGLSRGLTYYFAVYEYNSTNCFLMPALTGNITTVDEAIWTGTTSSDWFTTTNWSTGSLPTATTSVTIPSAPSNQPQINASGAVCKNITIDNGATLAMNASTAYTLSVYGDWTNNGSFSYGIGIVSFDNQTIDQTIGGSAQTDFYVLKVNKGSISKILEATAVITINPVSNNFILTAGTLKISSNSTITLLTSTSSLSINSSSGIWNNGGTINPTAKQCNVTGKLISSAGTSNFNFLITFGSANNIQIDGGSVNVTSYFKPSSLTTDVMNYSQSGGSLLINSSNSTTPMIINLGSTFNMSGGTIVLQKASANATTDFQNLASTYNVTGGTLQIGNGFTGSGQTIRINSTAPIHNLVVNSYNSPTAQLVTSGLTVNNDVTIGLNVKLDLNSLSFSVGGNWVNNGGSLTATPTGTVTLNGSSEQSIAGTSGTTFNNLTIDNATGVTTPNGLLTTVNGTLLINSSKKLTIGSGSEVTVGTLTNNSDATGLVIKSDAAGTGSLIANNASGTVSTERYLPKDQWHIVAPPVTNQGVVSFLTNSENSIAHKIDNGGFYGVTTYKESINDWDSYFTSAFVGNFNSGSGYLMRRQTTDGVVTFNGPIQYETVNIPVALSAGSGWNAVGNPFTSAIGITSASTSSQNFLTANTGIIDASYLALYLWDPLANSGAGGYVIINNTGFANPNHESSWASDYIQAGQGFIIRANANGNAVFSKQMQIHQPTLEFKSATLPLTSVIVNASNNQLTGSTAIILDDRMTLGLDPGFDAGIFKNNSDFNIYSRLVEDNNVDFALQCLPLNQAEKLDIPIGIDASLGGEINFSIEPAFLPHGLIPVLNDRLLNKSFAFTNTDDVYVAAVDKNYSGTDRFSLSFAQNQVSGNEDINLQEPRVWYNQGSIWIDGPFQGNETVYVYDISGRILKTSGLQINGVNKVEVQESATAVYLVKIKTDNWVKTLKVVKNIR